MSNDKSKNNSTELFWIQGEGMSRRNHNIEIIKQLIMKGETYQQIWMKCGRYFTSKKFDEYYNFALNEIKHGIEPIKLKESPKKEIEYGMHPCWNCGKVIPNNMNFCSEFCAKEYSGKKKKRVK